MGVSLGADLRAQLNKASKEMDMGISQILRQAAREWLAKRITSPDKRKSRKKASA